MSAPFRTAKDEKNSKRAPRKRSAPSEEESSEDIGSLQNIFGAIGSGFKRKMDSQRKKAETITSEIVEANGKRTSELYERQQTERKKLVDELVSKTLQIHEKWKCENERLKEEEERFMEIVEKHEKGIQRSRVAQMESLKQLKQIFETFQKTSEHLEEVHQKQHDSLQVENSKDMALLQKKLLMENQSKGIQNVRLSLQSMLSEI